ncbi:hypothetical protein F511_36355 [Dorcoceras hygrometricum]|uniref:Uncharacterized protein n=1 Tax=Dorcoceras hygrometricum TaxID=472368 RepID=A0A2Z7ABE4_9LAMI|nr:hypothetical protein F511_36355 [Dorcoceras hygrometricum]
MCVMIHVMLLHPPLNKHHLGSKNRSGREVEGGVERKGDLGVGGESRLLPCFPWLRVGMRGPGMAGNGLWTEHELFLCATSRVSSTTVVTSDIIIEFGLFQKLAHRVRVMWVQV